MITVILIFIAGILNACMDVLRYRWTTSIFRFWKNQHWINPALSWSNKWKLDTKIGDFIMSTFLVFLTDFWHFCKFLMLLAVFCSIVFYIPLINWWADILILYCTFTITFEVFFSKILIRKKNI